MRVIITSFGTRGDFEPLIALAEELTAHGHEPVFAIPSSAVDLFRPLPFSYSLIANGMPDIREEVNLIWSEKKDAYTSASRSLDSLSRLTEYFPDILKELTDLSSEASVLVSTPTQPLSRIVHELTGVPFVSVQFSHFGGNGGPALNDLGDTLVNSFRRKIGIGPVKHPLTVGANSPQLALYAMSPHLIGRPTEWPKHYHITGFFFRSQDLGPEKALIDFLMSGPPPVAICLGSMPHEDPEKLASLMIEATRRCGVRVVIQGFGRSRVPPMEEAAVYWAEALPHSYLFPRCACVVCHGGSGTSAQAFKAGIPIVFIPHGEIFDQRYWAQLSTELGCSPDAIPYLDLTVDKLEAALRACLDDNCLRNNARNLATKIQRENGVRRARHLIEAVVADIGLDYPLNESS